MLNKVADIVTSLQPHQQKALARGLANNLILAHNTGSGKTLTSIAIADALNKPTVVFTPASLVSNFEKEIAKHKKKGPKIDVISLATALSRDYQIPEDATVILDEAHGLRNTDTAKRKYIENQLSKAGRIIALTGTPQYNQPVDIASLVKLINPSSELPVSSSEFKKQFIKKIKHNPSIWNRILYRAKSWEEEKLTNTDKLKNELVPFIDIFDKDIDKPERIDETIKVPMSKKQLEVYRYVTKKLPLHLRYKIKKNIPPSKEEAAMLNTFLSAARQVSNTSEGFDVTAKAGPKLLAAVNNLKERLKKDPNFKALVYSNYIEAGVNAYSKLLSEENIPYHIFHGGLSKQDKQAIVNDYNSGKVPVILGTSSASEGLDLEGTKLIQILEPHFNNAKIEQVIGRGIRYKSHNNLPLEERKVKVQQYLSTIPDSKQTSVDEYLQARAKDKDILINEIKKLITE